MEKITGFTNANDIVVLNKLLNRLHTDKADVRYLLNNRIKSVKAAYYITLDDVAIRCEDEPGPPVVPGTFTLTLPMSQGNGKMYWIKNAGTGTITLQRSTETIASADRIDGSISITIPTKVCRQIVDSVKGSWDVI